MPEVILTTTIDVEEDNWGQYRSEITVENIREITRLQEFFDRFKIKPMYLVSYQVALVDWAVEILLEILSTGKCEIGAHLHPWNTPPIEESLTARNSMLGNLPYDLQFAKLKTLTEQIEEAFGKRPQSFRAGRWGLGSETIEALIACGYRIDTSVTPMISWEAEGNGPIYRDVETDPYWLSRNERVDGTCDSILEVPVTIGFNRWPPGFWQKVYEKLQKNWLRPLHPIGLFYHTGLLQKIWFSPEMNPANDMITLSNQLIKHGKQILNLSFHSSTLLPGKSPFVKNEEELEQFYSRIEKVLEHLTSATNLRSLTLSEVRQLVEQRKMECKPFCATLLEP